MLVELIKNRDQKTEVIKKGNGKVIADVNKDNFSLVINERSNAFRKRSFPNASIHEWNDWRWQQRNRFKDTDSLRRIIKLSGDEVKKNGTERFPISVTPYYASLLDVNNNLQPIRRTVIPSYSEMISLNCEEDDPLSEERDSPVPGIIHRYPDRVVLLTSLFCFTYCRYCTRMRFVGTTNESPFSIDYFENAFRYIRENQKIRDVLISGGDPFVLSNERIDWLLYMLKQIPHVEMLRIGTKAPVVLPQRITEGLVEILKKYHPLYISIHFTHPDELTAEVEEACARLADAGIPLGSQTVLLAGINDNVEILKALFLGLLKIRVKPYYLYQCDLVSGTSHFKTSIDKGINIIKKLRGYISGYAIPSYVIDLPGGGGKIPIQPNYIIGKEQGKLLLRNYKGEKFSYPTEKGDYQ